MMFFQNLRAFIFFASQKNKCQKNVFHLRQVFNINFYRNLTVKQGVDFLQQFFHVA